MHVRAESGIPGHMWIADHPPGGKSSRIVDLEGYLFGAFHHRFNRALRKERRRQETIEVLPSSGDLEDFREARDTKSALNLEQSIQIKEAVQSMDLKINLDNCLLFSYLQ